MMIVGGTVLPYKIIKKLGEGGMGVVYLAEDSKLYRKVPLKFLPDFNTDDHEVRERLYNEARAAASFSHLTVAHIHAIEDSTTGISIVMEYAEEESLKIGNNSAYQVKPEPAKLKDLQLNALVFMCISGLSLRKTGISIQ